MNRGMMKKIIAGFAVAILFAGISVPVQAVKIKKFKKSFLKI